MAGPGVLNISDFLHAATRVQRAYETSGARKREQQHVGTSPG
jgi:hypothetical protein